MVLILEISAKERVINSSVIPDLFLQLLHITSLYNYPLKLDSITFYKFIFFVFYNSLFINEISSSIEDNKYNKNSWPSCWCFGLNLFDKTDLNPPNFTYSF